MAPNTETVPTGLAALDGILAGGYARGRLHLVDGEPGSGKTTLGLHFLLAGRDRGERCVFVSLSESNDELTATARSHGWSLDGITLVELEPPSEATQYTFLRPSEVELSTMLRNLVEVVGREQAALVVLDSLSELRTLAGDQYRYRREIRALKQSFARRGCTVLVLDDQVGQSPDTHLYSIAHGVVHLERRTVPHGKDHRRLAVAKMRASPFRSGYHDFTIETGGLRIFPRLAHAAPAGQVPGERLGSGIQGIDTMLFGGIERGTSTLLVGPSGIGKSALATAFVAAGLQRGEHGAVFVFDETRERYLARARAIRLGLPPDPRDDEVLLRQVNPAELSPGELIDMAVQAVEQRDTRIVVIDSLNGYLNALQSESASEMTTVMLLIRELLTFLSQRGVSTILVSAQHGISGSELTNIDISHLADNVFLLRYFEAAGRIRRALSVMKQRSSAHETAIREFRIDSRGIHIGEPLEQFHGVLSGTPTYHGSEQKLLRPRPHDRPGS